MGSAVSRTDSGFGPLLFGADDFTLIFEESIFTTVPSVIAIVVSIIQFASVVGERRLVHGGLLLCFKAILGLLFVGVSIATLALWTSWTTFNTQMTLPAAGLAVAQSVFIFFFLFTEHLYSYRPSTFLSLFLSITLLLEIAKTYSCFNRLGQSPVPIMYTLNCIVRALLLLSQEISKRRLIISKTDKDSNLGSEATSGFWNRALFLWTNSTLLLGFQKILKVEDLEPLCPRFRTMSLFEVFKTHWDKANRDSSAALAKTCLLAQAVPIAIIILPRLCQSGFTFAQPFLVLRTVRAVAEEGLLSSTSGGLLGATFLIYFGIAISKGYSNHLSYQVTICIRGMLTAAIYHKMLSLSHETLAESAAVTLMSNDLTGVERFIPLSHDMWASIVELGFGMGILGALFGPSCVLLVIPSLVTTVGSSIITKRMSVARTAWNEMIQARITKTSNILAQLKVVKMLGASNALHGLLQRFRVAEIDSSLGERQWRVIISGLGAFSSGIPPVLVIAGTLYWTRAGDTLSSGEIYTTLTVVSIISEPLSTLLMAIPSLSRALSSFPRMQKFLCLPEQTNSRSTDPRYTSAKVADLSVNLGSSKSIVSEVNMQIEPGTVSVVSGPVGCGKTTFLKSLLGEIPLQSGFIEMPLTAIAYADQDPWLQNMSIRDNICQGNFDAVKYKRVLAACALVQDLSALPDGDETIVGTNASNISGGQKQRVALARAAYADASFLVLDDPLSSVDSATTASILEALFGENGFVRNSKRTVIMTTSSPETCRSIADVMFSMSREGAIERLNNQVENRTGDTDSKQLATDHENASETRSENGDDDEKERADEKSRTATRTDAIVPTVEVKSEHEDYKARKGDYKLYMYYLGSTTITYMILLYIAGASSSLAERIPAIYIRIWQQDHSDGNGYFAGFTGLSVARIVVTMAGMWLFLHKIVVSASNTLHERLLTSVMRASLPFLAETDGGSMLNRFSQDIGLISHELPIDFFNTLYMVNTVVIDVAVISAGAKYVAFIIPGLAIVLYGVQFYYLRTSRQLRIRELEARAPLFTLFTETANGIQHIRAFNWQDAFLARMQDLLDYSQTPYYALFCVQRWLTMVIDLTVCAIAAILVAMALWYRDSTSPNAVGLAMLTVVTFSITMSFMVETLVDLEISIGAVGRVKTFCELTPQEEDESSSDIPPNWPLTGRIEFRNVGASYRKLNGSSHEVLKDVSFIIGPGEKLGLSGRTGSGKSTILAVLLRMTDYTGSILIDGSELRTVPRELVRSRFITITQDGLRLQGSIRLNLDPHNPPDYNKGARLDDSTISTVLTRVGLWDAVRSCGGLDADMTAASFSQGQMQLLGIARAILRQSYTHSNVILIDEATSSIDTDTDKEVQGIIANAFSGCTVLMTSHRLYAFDNTQKVIKLSNGAVKETLERDPTSGLLEEAQSA